MPDNATIAMISVTTGYAPDIIFLFTALSFVAPDKSKTSSQNTGAVVSTYSSRDLTGPFISCMTPTFINLLDTIHSSNVVNIVLLGDKDLVGNKLHVKSTTRRHSTYNHVILYIFIYKYIYIYVYIITYLYLTIRCSAALGLPTRKGGSLVTNNLVATWRRCLKYNTPMQQITMSMLCDYLSNGVNGEGVPSKKLRVRCLKHLSILSTFNIL